MLSILSSNPSKISLKFNSKIFFSSPFINFTYLSKLGKYNVLSVFMNTDNSFSQPTFEFVAKAVAEEIAAPLNAS